MSVTAINLIKSIFLNELDQMDMGKEGEMGDTRNNVNIKKCLIKNELDQIIMSLKGWEKNSKH